MSIFKMNHRYYNTVEVRLVEVEQTADFTRITRVFELSAINKVESY